MYVLGCHEEWISGLDSCYRFFTGAENIETVNFQCLSLNSSLVSIESIEENHFLSNIVASIDKTHGKNIRHLLIYKQRIVLKYFYMYKCVIYMYICIKTILPMV